MTVEYVVDGDTMRLRGPAYWPSFVRSMLIRIKGVATPEKGKRAKGKREATYAFTASQQVKKMYPAGSRVSVRLQFKDGKYEADKYWRLLGDVKPRKIGAVWLSTYLIDNGLAAPYDGGTKSNIWC